MPTCPRAPRTPWGCASASSPGRQRRRAQRAADPRAGPQLPARARRRPRGGWNVAQVVAPSHDLEGRTVGIVGFGAIGARTALRLEGFDVTMLYYADHRRTAGEESSLGVRYARLDTLIAESHVVCLALPLMDGSEAMTIHCSGKTLVAQDRIAEGVTEMLDTHLAGWPVPEDFLVVSPAS